MQHAAEYSDRIVVFFSGKVIEEFNVNVNVGTLMESMVAQ